MPLYGTYTSSRLLADATSSLIIQTIKIKNDIYEYFGLNTLCKLRKFIEDDIVSILINTNSYSFLLTKTTILPAIMIRGIAELHLNITLMRKLLPDFLVININDRLLSASFQCGEECVNLLDLNRFVSFRQLHLDEHDNSRLSSVSQQWESEIIKTRSSQLLQTYLEFPQTCLSKSFESQINKISFT